MTATPVDKTAPAKESGQDRAHDEIVCGCANLSQSDLRRMIADGIGSFDNLMQATGAGKQCTACLLDLEYCFTAYQQAGAGSTVSAGQPVNQAESPKLRHRLYRIIDRLAPQLPLTLPNSQVVIAGRGIRQWVTVANDSMLFEGDVSAPPMGVELKVRNADGDIRHSSRHVLAAGEALREEISGYLGDPPEDGLAVGRVDVVRRAIRSGYRGTTRPQVLIDGPGGTGSVHTQASHGPGDLWMSYIHQPESQRFFVGLLNDTGRPLDFTISYPFAAAPGAELESGHHVVTVPPRGARLHEVRLTEKSARRLDGKLISLRCRSRGRGGRKATFICASHALDRFSIDHPGG